MRTQNCYKCDRSVIEVDECIEDDDQCPLSMKDLYYKDMELVYKPTMDRLRDDMNQVKKLAQQIAMICHKHDWPMPKTGTEPTIPDALIDPNPFRGDGFPNNMPHHDLRTASLQDVYDQVDRDSERKGDL